MEFLGLVKVCVVVHEDIVEGDGERHQYSSTLREELANDT